VALVVQEDRALSRATNAPTLVVPDTRRALPALAAAFYDDPSQAFKLIGITGTNGKTTTTLMIASILRVAGLKTGTIGTLGTELTEASSKPFVAAINLDDPHGAELAEATFGTALTYAVQNEKADIRAEEVRISADSIAFRAILPSGAFEIALHIGGSFQVYNALAAATVGVGMGFAPEVVADGLAALNAVP